MSSQKQNNNIQVTYIHSRTPPPPKETASQPQPTTIKEEHVSDEEYIKLIAEERAKYTEAKKTIAKLVNKVCVTWFNWNIMLSLIVC